MQKDTNKTKNKNQDKTPNRKQTQILNKWDEKWNRQLWEGRGDAHLKKCPMSSATRKIKLKTDLMLHLIPPITANVKMMQNIGENMK